MRYQFDGCVLDTDRYELRRGDDAVHLERQVFDVLVYLIDHRDRVVPKSELLDEIWGDRFVSESALTSRVKSARQAVGDTGRDQRLIKTIHGRGYQFVAAVDTRADIGADAIGRSDPSGEERPPAEERPARDDRPPREERRSDRPSRRRGDSAGSPPAVGATGTATIMFTDLVASTDTRIAVGETRFTELISEHDLLLGEAIRSNGGEVVKHTGDGLMAVFTAASQGVAAAVDIQRRIVERNRHRDQAIGVRIGLGAGDVAERAGDYHGVAVVEAARLCAAATDGQVLASESVHRLAGSHGGHEYVALGELDLKGLPGHASVAVRWAEDAPVASPSRSVLGNLPARLDRFVGRESDLTEVATLVHEQRLVTLTGGGGSGKTRLALEVAARVADEFPDAVWLVPLADLDDGRLIVETTADALGVRNGSGPSEALRSHLSHRDTLLVLDNCEHVIDAAAPFVTDLLAACPDVRMLATSREPLRVPGECEYSVDPLSKADAEELLLERRPGGKTLGGADHEAVARICEAVDGIPLAIELAAARLRVLSLGQIADRLDDQLAILTDGGRSRPDRQQTLRATLDWSHDLLEDEEPVAFRRLAVFAGGFTLDAAQEVVGGDGIDRARVPDLIEQLAIRSLVGPAPGDGIHLRMLEPVRQYARDRLEASGEHDAIAARHLAWAGALSSELGRAFFVDQRDATARARLEHANICHALEFALRTGRLPQAVRIVAGMVYPWLMMGQPDGQRWVDRTLSASPPDAPARIRADAVFAAAMFAVNEGDAGRSVPLLQEALERYEESGRARSHAWVLTWLGRAGRQEIEGRSPEDWFSQALEEFTALDDIAGMGWSLTLLARLAIRNDDLDLAEERARSALELAEGAGIDQVAADARRWLAVTAHLRGDTGRAEELITDAARAHGASGDRWQQAVTLATAAGLACARDDPDRAATLLVQALGIVAELPEGEATVNVLVAACSFFVLVDLASEVAPLVLGLPAEDEALLRRVALSQGSEDLHDVLATEGRAPAGRHSLHDAVAMASTSVAGWCAARPDPAG